MQGKHVFKGYLEEEDNRSVWIDHLGERFYNTGDLGKYDSDGYLWLTGRSKELIIRGGHNIDPLSVESPFYEHVAVELVAAVGRPRKNCSFLCLQEYMKSQHCRRRS